MSDVWTDIHRIKHNKKRDPHPCQLPIHLLDRLILLSTNENDIVLDPFSGTGTTAISAKRLGRKFIGFELDSDYVNITNEKLGYIEPNYKLGNSFVSFYLNDVITIRNKDWDKISEYFIIPKPMRTVDFAKTKLKSKTLIPKEKEILYKLNECKLDKNGFDEANQLELIPNIEMEKVVI